MKKDPSKHELILEAALREFQENGFERASMDRITEGAGVSKRTVYNHFQCKITLFQTVISVMAERLKDSDPLQFDPKKPILEQLIDLGRMKGKMLRSDQFMQLIRVAMSETLRDPDLAKALSQKSNEAGDYAAFFEAAVKSKCLVADDPSQIETQFIGLIKSQAFWPAIFSGEVLSEADMDKVIVESAKTIVAAYGAQ